MCSSLRPHLLLLIFYMKDTKYYRFSLKIVILMRAELDALPILEQTTLP